MPCSVLFFVLSRYTVAHSGQSHRALEKKGVFIIEKKEMGALSSKSCDRCGMILGASGHTRDVCIGRLRQLSRLEYDEEGRPVEVGKVLNALLTLVALDDCVRGELQALDEGAAQPPV